VARIHAKDPAWIGFDLQKAVVKRLRILGNHNDLPIGDANPLAGVGGVGIAPGLVVDAFRQLPIELLRFLQSWHRGYLRKTPAPFGHDTCLNERQQEQPNASAAPGSALLAVRANSSVRGSPNFWKLNLGSTNGTGEGAANRRKALPKCESNRDRLPEGRR
jgi:hypothetical protein